MARKYRATIQTSHGPMQGLEVSVQRTDKPPLVARFGGIPLRRLVTGILIDERPPCFIYTRNELIKRLVADTRELCGAGGDCEVHHIRKLADLKQKRRREKPVWVQMMAARRRKTRVVCHTYHTAIHAGQRTRGIVNLSTRA